LREPPGGLPDQAPLFRLFHLVFEFHAGRAMVPIPETLEGPWC
jgi:hypothetical protein